MPNISATKQRKRKLLSNVVNAILLYGAPIWSEDLKAMTKVQMRIAHRVASAYRTVSGNAIGVITGIIPLDIQVSQRRH